MALTGKWLFTSALLCGSVAAAQMPSGWIQGRVTDRAAAAGIPGAEVVLEDPNERVLLRSRSDGSGGFLFLGLPPGAYGLRFRKEGYPEYRIRSVEVQDAAMSLVALDMERGESARQKTVVLSWRKISSDPLASVLAGRFERAEMDNLPGARNIWALLQNREISSVTHTIDEGGIHTGVPALIGVHGGTWTQNSYRWDGLNVTDPRDPGKPLVYPGYGGIQEFRVASDDHAAVSSATGAEFQIISRRGQGQLFGRAEAYYLGDPLQNSNLDGRLRAFGFQTAPHFRRFPEGEFSIGGPLRKSADWLFFSSLGFQSLSKVIPGFSGTPATAVYPGSVRLDGAPRPRDQISLLAAGALVRHSNLGARMGTDPTATLRASELSGLVQARWTHLDSSKLVYELGFGFARASAENRFQGGTTRPNYTRLFTGEMTGAAPLEYDSARSRISILGQMQTFRTALQNWRHQLAFGAGFERSFIDEDQRIFRGLRLFTFPEDVPSEVAVFGDSGHTRARLHELSFYAEDRLQISGRVFIRLGLNLDASGLYLPEQTEDGGSSVPVRRFAGGKSVVSWITLSPRFGFSIPVRKNGRALTLHAGYSRYYNILPGAYADFADPDALGGRIYRWNDSNGDGAFQQGEAGTLLRVFGGPYSSVDSGLRRPFTDEYQAGLEQAISHYLHVGVRFLQRDARHLVHTVNVGVPPSAYTPVPIMDLGDDGVAGTSDDRILTAFNQDLAALGQDRYLLTNPARLNSTYKGMEATLAGGPFPRGFFSVSFAAYRSEGDGNPGNSETENDPGVAGSLFDDPNTLMNSRGRLFFDRAFLGKVSAWYQAPLGFYLGSVISYLDGLPFGRKLIIPDFNQGPFYIMATPRGQPGGVRTQYALTLDQRIARDFRLGRIRASAMIDIFNLLNLNKSLREFDISGPQFARRQPTDIENPRAFRLGLMMSF